MGSKRRIKCFFGAPGPAESLSGRMTYRINERLTKINRLEKCSLDKKKICFTAAAKSVLLSIIAAVHVTG